MIVLKHCGIVPDDLKCIEPPLVIGAITKLNGLKRVDSGGGSEFGEL